MKSACNGNETACGERLLISDIDGSEEEKYPEEKNRFRIKAKIILKNTVDSRFGQRVNK